MFLQSECVGGKLIGEPTVGVGKPDAKSVRKAYNKQERRKEKHFSLFLLQEVYSADVAASNRLGGKAAEAGTRGKKVPLIIS